MRPGPLDSDGRTAAITGVSGGTGELAAPVVAMEALAGVFAAVGLRLGGHAAAAAAVMTSPDLRESALIAPDTFARAEAALARAELGGAGAARGAVAWEQLALGVQGAVALLREADESADALARTVRGAVALGSVVIRARLYDPEGGHLTVPRPDLIVPGSDRAPGGIEGIAAHLAELSMLSDAAHPENNGTIEIQTFVDPDGGRRHLVYLPGTDDMLTLPWTEDHDVRDMPANLALLGGLPTAYGAGVVDAMGQAGIAPDEPVLLAGHSQGGMQAAALLADRTPYLLAGAVTLGAPIGGISVPAGVPVLALENRADLVPKADGARNPGTVDEVTVTFSSTDSGKAANHDFSHYLAGAGEVDASDDPSVRGVLDRLGGFLAGGARVESRLFQVTRAR